MLCISDNPPVLPPGVDALQDLQGSWFIGHTKSRCERAFAWDLIRNDVGYYLPLIEEVKVFSGKKRRLFRPLFPSYVFFCGGPESRYTALTTGRLCQVIPVTNQRRLIRELLCIEQAMTAGSQLDPYPFAAVGRRCVVTGGPFEGLEGVVVQRNSTSRLVLEVSMLGQGASLEIDTDLLEPVDDAPAGRGRLISAAG